MALPDNQDQLAFDAQMRQSHSQPPSLDDFDVTPEKEGILLGYIRYCKCMAFTLITENIYLCVLGTSTDSEGLEVSSSVSHGNISILETV